MAHQSWKRSGLGLTGSTESSSERTLHSNEYGQGTGWWIQHQCDVLVARAQEQLDEIARRQKKELIEINTHSTVRDNPSVEATTPDRILQIALVDPQRRDEPSDQQDW